MKLASFEAGTPVFVVKAVVSYQTPRVPTAVEKMVLRLVKRAESHPVVAQASLRQAFGDMLGMADAPLLLGPRLEELTGLGVLQAPKGADLLGVPLSAWQLTPKGREVLLHGLLPRRPDKREQRYTYDLVKDALVLLSDEAQPTYQPQPLPVGWDGSYPAVDFGPRVREALGKAKPDWIKPSTVIEGVTVSWAETRWRGVPLQLDVDAEGTLALKAPSDAVCDTWLRRAQPDRVWKHLIAPVLGDEPGDAGIRRVSLSGAASVEPCTAVPEAAKAATRQRPAPAFVVLGVDDASAAPRTGPVDVVRLHAHRGAQDSLLHREPVDQDGPDQGVVVSLPMPMPAGAGLPEGFQRLEIRRPGAAPQVTVAGVATVTWAGQGRTAMLRVGLAQPAAEAAWVALRPRLETWVVSQAAPHHMAVAAWFEPLETVVERWCKRTSVFGPREWFTALTRFIGCLRARLELKEPLDGQQWANALVEAGHLALNRLMDGVRSIGAGLELLALLRPLPVGRAALSAEVLSRMPPMDSMTEVMQVREALEDTTVVLPASLLGKQVRVELLQKALQGDAPPPCGIHALQPALREFARACKQARQEMPAVLLDDAQALSPAWYQALRRQPERTLKAAEAIEAAMFKVNDALGYAQWQVAEPLQPLVQRLEALRRWIDEALEQPLSLGQQAVVIDVKALLDTPDLLGRMPKQDVPVIPSCVIDELESFMQAQPSDPKDVQDRARRARQASQAIEAMRQRIRLEPSRRARCAADLQPSTDHEILAVAVYYRLSPVVLLSTNRDLGQKAQAERLIFKTPAQYLPPSVKPKPPGKPSRERSTAR